MIPDQEVPMETTPRDPGEEPERYDAPNQEAVRDRRDDDTPAEETSEPESEPASPEETDADNVNVDVESEA